MNIFLGVIEIINKCNLHCKHCYGNFTSGRRINLNEFKYILKQLRSVNCKILNLTGGEPLLLGKKLQKYIEVVKANHIKYVNLLTNGLLISDFETDFFRQFSTVQVSVDGDFKNHEYIRGPNTYFKTINNMVKLANEGVKVHCMFTVNENNIRDIPNVYNFCKNNNIKFNVEIFTATNPNKKIKILSKENYKHLINFCVKYKLHCNDPIINVIDKKKMSYLMLNRIFCGCSAGISAIVINANLDVYVCPRIRVSIGSLKRESLISILNHSQLIRDLNNRNRLLGRCGECNYKFICGGCRTLAMTIDKDKNIFAENSYCFV